MTTPQGTAAAAADDTTVNTVVTYLREHPDFFNHHPELLHELAIPHPSGEAVSLVERQLVAIREENLRLKRHFEAMVNVAKANEKLNARIHELVLELMEAAGPRAIFNALYTRLSSGFAADAVAVRIYGNAEFIDNAELEEFIGRDGRARSPFRGVLEHRKPLCGRLNRAQGDMLFAALEPEGSAVVLALRGKGWDGLLGIYSKDGGRFEPDMGTEIVTYLSDVVSLILDPWVAGGAEGH